MTTIKFVIICITMLEVIIKHENISSINLYVIALFVGILLSTLLVCVYVMIFWPLLLKDEKINFFKVPDKEMKKLFLKHMSEL